MSSANQQIVTWGVLTLVGAIFCTARLINTWGDDRNLKATGIRGAFSIVQRAANIKAVGFLLSKIVAGVIIVQAVAVFFGTKEHTIPPGFFETVGWEIIIFLTILTGLDYVDWQEHRDLRDFHTDEDKLDLALQEVARLTAATHKETVVGQRRLLAAVKENTELTRHADEHAVASFKEANSVNLKIEAATKAIADKQPEDSQHFEEQMGAAGRKAADMPLLENLLHLHQAQHDDIGGVENPEPPPGDPPTPVPPHVHEPGDVIHQAE